jgi:hypothetical protein
MGDVNPIDHGGQWVLRDKTGVYCPELEILEVPEDEDGVYVIYRLLLEPCTFVNGVLSDNKYHPDLCAWWATTPERMAARPQDGKGLISVSESQGWSMNDLIAGFCSDDPEKRAWSYMALVSHHGAYSFDQEPIRLTRAGATKRYKGRQYQLV